MTTERESMKYVASFTGCTCTWAGGHRDIPARCIAHRGLLRHHVRVGSPLHPWPPEDLGWKHK